MPKPTPPTIAADSFSPPPISTAPGRVWIRDDSEIMVGNSHRHPWKASYPCLIPIMLCFCLLAFASPALAHRVLVYAYAEGDTIHTESKFVGSGAVQQGQVQILDQKTGKLLLTGTTDDQGRFAFKIPTEATAHKLDLLIVVEASMGHRGEWQMKAESYLPTAETAAGAAPTAPGPAAAVTPTPEAFTTATPPAPPDIRTPAVDRQMVEDAMNKALERQLAPIKEMLTELTIHRTSLTDIIGGIGYILGIFGLLAYFQSRKKKDS
jgi:nickel transport protein